jgi:hypothetical protein
MCCHLLRHFEFAAVGEVSSNSGCPECMAADQGLNPCTGSVAPDHEINIGLRHAAIRELLPFYSFLLTYN